MRRWTSIEWCVWYSIICSQTYTLTPTQFNIRNNEVKYSESLTAPDRLPQEAQDALNEFSNKLTTQDLIDLNRKVSGEQQMNPADAAAEWLSDNGYQS